MLSELFRLYQASQTNPRSPKCPFPENRIFGEDWLLRVVLQRWQGCARLSRFPFLPFPQQALVYSEAQLSTPFSRRSGGDLPAEGKTHADGIVGDIEIVGRTGVILRPDWQYLSVFEAKMFSPLGKGTANAAGYDQVSRTAACMIHTMLEAEALSESAAYLVVLYPRDNRAIDPQQYGQSQIAQRIAVRVEGYRSPERRDFAPRFRENWRAVLPRVQIQFVTWEEVLAEIEDENLDEFYRLCLQFNRRN